METGVLKKLKGEWLGPTQAINYQLPFGDLLLPLNNLLGKKLKLEFSGLVFCIACAQKTKKSFGQGFCYHCFMTLAQTDMCNVRPQTCHFDQGTCRDAVWAKSQCFIPHTVYLSYTSSIKVGITRKYQQLTRWIDQGATQALPVLTVPDRKSAGLVEVILAKHFPDKTQWQKMIKNVASVPEELNSEKQRVYELLKNEFPLDDPLESSYLFTYPILRIPETIKSLKPEKNPLIEGVFWGIKGQYLIFDTGVFNVRNCSGYECTIGWD